MGPRPTSLASLQKQAEDWNSLMALPIIETTTNGVRQAVARAIEEGNTALNAIASLRQGQLTFQNTIRALDDMSFTASKTANRIYLLKETNPDEALREAGNEAIKEFETWSVGLDYREDVYKVVQAFADTQPALEGESKKVLEETLRDYRRAGLHLPQAERDKVEALRKELASASTDFEANITKAKAPLTFTRAELAGVPDTFLDQPDVKTGEDAYIVQPHITWHFLTVMDNARPEATRQKLYLARNTLAKDVNVPLLQHILRLRHEIARMLGYQTWADYRIEPKMAGNAATAHTFLLDLNVGLQEKYTAELDALRELKEKETGQEEADLQPWDVRYYTNQLKKERYAVDAEQLRAYFPYDAVLQGMFRIYEQIFGLKITTLEAPQKWVEDLQLYAVTDAATGEPLGLLYMDMFPREGKYGHFAQFPIIPGKRLPDGRYQRPTAALICNFPKPAPGTPSLLTHSDVETLFHEFGHAMHTMLTRAETARFSGTSVPRDFVEAPSQMLENWVWDKAVLDSFAAHYQRPDEKIPQAILDQLKAAKLATIGSYYRRQLAFGLLDLALHMEDPNTHDCVELSNRILSDVTLPVPEGTAFVAYFGHLMGYDAGYYGYAWADAISADMATVFEAAPGRYFDVAAGHRLRDEIYAPGGSRDANISIEKFLGRERSLAPFLKTLGLE